MFRQLRRTSPRLHQGRPALPRLFCYGSRSMCGVAFYLRVAVLLLASAALSAGAFAQEAPSSAAARPAQVTPKNYLGNEDCAKCHAEIYKSYSATAMAHASGPAMQGLLTGDFVHAPSRVHYRVYAEDGKAWMSFDRPGDNQI